MTTYHPRYRTGGDVVIQSSDSVCFRYSFKTLVEASPFFASLATLPPPSSGDGENALEANVIPLPNICTAAVAVVLDALGPGSVHGEEIVASPGGAGQAVSDIFDCVDAYELPGRLIRRVYKALRAKEPACPPSVLFAMSIITGLGNARYWSCKMVGAGRRSMDPWAVDVLRTRHLDVFRRLCALFRTFDGAFSRFWAATALMGVDNNFAFGSRCKTSPGCPTLQEFDGRFDDFHADARARISRFARQYPQLMQSERHLLKFCEVFIKCPRCRLRIVQAAVAAFAQHMPRKVWCLQSVHGNPRSAEPFQNTLGVYPQTSDDVASVVSCCV